ncbi:MAG: acyl carrier protein [Solirubrobacterales bacterium]|nr:acyl carrier protein [Solirubrobacterales bacterium]
MATATRDQVATRVEDALVEFGADRDAIADDATFEALDIDSLDLVELAQIVEDDYGVALTTKDLEGIDTVGKAIDLVVERVG